MSQSNKTKAKNTIDRRGRRKKGQGAKAKSACDALAASHATNLRGPGAQVSKLTSILAMLRRPKGATIEQMMTVTGWQAHSVRGAMSGALKKKRGLTVSSTAENDGTRVYRVVE